MEKPNQDTSRKKQYEKSSYEHKLFVINQINNGQISLNFASKKYNIGRSTLNYWMKKLTPNQDLDKNLSLQAQIKKLKDKVDELEFVKSFQQEIIAEFEHETGKELSKKYLPESLAREIQLKKKNRLNPTK